MTNAPLTDEDRAQLSARADEFHSALVREGTANWERYLAGLAEHVRLAVLAELIIIDLGHRWHNGERPVVEDYLARFPEFGPTERVPSAVILEEHRCRIKAGERPQPESFRSRFPSQYPLICAEVESGHGATVSGTVVATIASADGGAAIAQSVSPGGTTTEYEFLRVLGRGVFGEVWLAQKKASGIEKAVKILLQAADHETANRERRSLELIKNLRHPYLLATDDFWIADNRLHVAMELADGTLRDQLRKHKEAGERGIPVSQLLGYMWEAAEGLDFLHSRHVVHRDIKPDNILLLHGHAKVGDFGLARYQEEVLAPMRTFAGTPAYMAPEVWGREGGPASDQYSLAIAYAELRQGVPPLRPRPIQQMLLAHSEGQFEFADIIGAEEQAVILKALSHKPEERYPSCRAFVDALCGVLGHSGVPRAAGTFSSGPVNGPGYSQEPTQPNSEMLATHLAKDDATVVDDAPPEPPKPVTLRQLTVVIGVALVLALGGIVGLWHLLTKRGGGGPDDVGLQEPWLPPGAVAAPEAKEVPLADGRRVYEWVEKKLGNQTVRFRFIAGGGGVRPFYVMESKVWNELYRDGGSDPPPLSVGNGSHAPVVFLTAEEAAAFARKFGGALPSPEQWDHAAGLFAVKDRNAVTLPPGKPLVREKQPKPTTGPDASDDWNEFRLRDMAGNGREWTSGVLPAEADGRISGIVRGRSFTMKDGLTFQHLRDEQKQPQTQFVEAGSPYTSFRVVLPGP